METLESLPVLDAFELRVLGSLMEKARTTPDYYPMTVNGLAAACNQKTSRNPVMNLDEETVLATLNSLKKKGLVSTATGGTSRSVKYKHNLALAFPIEPPEISVLTLLILRGPLTAGELHTNSGRLYPFDSLEEVQVILEKLAGYPQPFVQHLPKSAGQKEIRYKHLLGIQAEIAEYTDDPQPGMISGSFDARLDALEQQMAAIKTVLNKLVKELGVDSDYPEI